MAVNPALGNVVATGLLEMRHYMLANLFGGLT